MSRKSKPRSGSMLLKFSDTSITSTRAMHARHSAAAAAATSTNSTENDTTLGNNVRKRRKFFNSSTEFLHVINLLTMNFCRQVTNQNHLKRRLVVYICLVLIGGLLNDFASVIIRAFVLHLSPKHIFNWLFVKFGWAWNTMLLLPLISLSSHALNSVKQIELDKVEKSLEDLHQRRYRQLSSSSNTAVGNTTTPTTTNNNFSIVNEFATDQNQTKPIWTLNTLSNKRPSKLAKQIQSQLIQLASVQSSNSNLLHKLKRLLFTWFNIVCVKDVLRLLLSTGLYFASILLFTYIQSITARGNKLVSNANAVAIKNNGRSSSLSSSSSSEMIEIVGYQGLDISGHVYILILSNLIILEECHIMIGWEPLSDRLFDLSREYMNLETENLVRPGIQLFESLSELRCSETNRALFLAWYQFQQYSTQLRVLFLLSTLLTLLWDFMLIQTALFYHNLAEKMIALGWAILCWYLLYRWLFPLLQLEAKKPTDLQTVDSENKN